MFSKLKKAYSEYKENKEYEKQLDKDMCMRDKIYRQEVRKQARKEFEDDRKEALEFRKNYLLAEERKKYDSKRKKLNDTRTKSQKFQSGMKKLGKVANRVTGDTKQWSSGLGDFSSNIGNKAAKNLGVSKKQTSFSDRIRRNL